MTISEVIQLLNSKDQAIEAAFLGAEYKLAKASDDFEDMLAVLAYASELMALYN